jgi:hypothetical protein
MSTELAMVVWKIMVGRSTRLLILIILQQDNYWFICGKLLNLELFLMMQSLRL